MNLRLAIVAGLALGGMSQAFGRGIAAALSRKAFTNGSSGMEIPERVQGC